jgi:hypothetical protein
VAHRVSCALVGGVVDEQRLTTVLVEFARTLTGDFSIQKILDHLVDRVVEVIPVSGAGVLLMDSDTEHHFVAASDDVIHGIETLQMQLQEGPCLQAYRTGQHVAIRDLAQDTMFARFSPAAAQAGRARSTASRCAWMIASWEPWSCTRRNLLSCRMLIWLGRRSSPM